MSTITASSAGRAADDDTTRAIEDLDLASLLDRPSEVWTATKTEQKRSQAPAIITTVTREQIAIWGYRSVAEVLGHLLGFYVIDDHTFPNLAVRGISGGLHADSSTIKVLIDGHSVAFHSTGGNALGPELLPLSAVERIEVVRGPGSALFGADAFLGVVNIKTRSGDRLDGAVAALGAGRVGDKLATDLDGAAGFARGAFDLMVSARRTGQDLSGLALPASSPAPSIPAYNFGAREAQGMDQQATTVLGRASYRPGAGTELAVFGYFSSMRRGAEFGALYQLAHGVNAQGVLSQNRVGLDQLRAGLLWDQALGSTVRLSTRGTVFRGAPAASNRLEVGSEFYYVRRQFGFRGGDLDSQIEWRPGWVPGLRLVAGGSLLVDDELLPSRLGVAKQPIGAAAPGDLIESISVSQGRKVFLNTGAYLQGMSELLGPALSLTGGVRYDHHNVYGGQLSERVGLVSNPLASLHAKLLYGSAFKAPSPLLLHAVPSAIGDVTGNPNLKPQYVRTVEFQVGYEGRSFLEVSSNVAYSVLHDKTEFVQQGINQVARNVARAETLSWETIAELRFRRLVHGHVSFEAQRTVRQTGQVGYSADVVGRDGGIYPRAIVHAGVVGQPPRWPVRAAVQASYVGSRRPSDANILLNGGPYQLPPYLLLEAGLSTIDFQLPWLDGAVSIAATGKNLLGVVGPTPGFSGVDYPVAPRTFFLQLNLTL